MTDRAHWDGLVDIANSTRKLLDDKPLEHRIRFAANTGGILNAYREGDATFDEAVAALEALRDDRVRAALRAILDAIDYKAGNCRVNDMVGSVLPGVLIERAREALR